MELPIVSKFSDEFVVPTNTLQYEKINILDIDGIYLVNITRISRIDKTYIKSVQVAFSSLFEAQDYLHYELGIDMPGHEEEDKSYEDWREYL